MQRSPKANYVILATALVGAGLYYVRFGYAYGFSDQDEFIPLVMKWLNTDLFVNDWFVQQQGAEFGIRTFFAGMVAAFSSFLSVEVAVLVLHGATWALISWALYTICYTLYRNELLSFVFVLLSLVVTARWNPGSNDVVHSMLVPSSVAWALSLAAIVWILRRKLILASIFCGVATLIHPLVGLQLGALLSLGVLLTEFGKSYRFLVPYGAIALLLILAFSGLGSQASMPLTTGLDVLDSSTQPSTQAVLTTVTSGNLNLLTHVRAPHHYLPTEFLWSSWIKLGLLCLIGLPLLWFDSVSWREGYTRNLVLILVATTLVVIAVSLVAVGLFEMDLPTRLQPFNLTVFLRLLALLGVVGALSKTKPFAVPLKTEDMLRSHFILFASVLFFSASILWGRTTYLEIRGQDPQQGQKSEFLDIETGNWIRSNTPTEALFIIPPSMSGFQIRTARAQYVNFKAFPFGSEATAEWLTRLLSIAPVDSLLPGGTALAARLDRAYLASTPHDLQLLMELQNIDYILRPRETQNNWDVSAATWCSPIWCIFEPGSFLSESI